MRGSTGQCGPRASVELILTKTSSLGRPRRRSLDHGQHEPRRMSRVVPETQGPRTPVRLRADRLGGQRVLEQTEGERHSTIGTPPTGIGSGNPSQVRSSMPSRVGMRQTELDDEDVGAAAPSFDGSDCRTWQDDATMIAMIVFARHSSRAARTRRAELARPARVKSLKRPTFGAHPRRSSPPATREH